VRDGLSSARRQPVSAREMRERTERVWRRLPEVKRRRAEERKTAERRRSVDRRHDYDREMRERRRHAKHTPVAVF